MTAPTVDRDALIADAQDRYDRYLRLARRAVRNDSSRWLRRRAAVLAVEAASILPDLIAALEGRDTTYGGDAA